MRIALGIEYDGTAYAGWQKQANQTTLQATLEAALTKIANHTVNVHCAGRTDAGVHARLQVVHFDTCMQRNLSAWILGTNTHLPADIRVHWAALVNEQFHARFSALARTYTYYILTSRTQSALLRQRVFWFPHDLSINALQEAAQLFIGEHDFSSFRARGCQARVPYRRVKALFVERQADLIGIEITANAFLHHMVRNIVGVLLMIGQGKRSPEWVNELLLAKDRTLAGTTAPAMGLYLSHVEYPVEFGLPIARKADSFQYHVL